MPTTTAVRARPNPESLRQRLGVVRRRLRLVAATRGIGWLISASLVPLLVGGLLDWRFQLPPLVRGVLLVATLAMAGTVAVRYLFRPMAGQTDDLTLALRIEERFPGFNDALASTVQFLGRAEGDVPLESESLRRAAIEGTLGRAQGLDFTRVVDSRGLRSAVLTAAMVVAAFVALAVVFPVTARTALVRIADPFGRHEWPRQTQIEVVTPRERIGRNEAFEVRAALHGVIPDQASVTVEYDGLPPITLTGEVAKADPSSGRFLARLPPDRVQRSFRFRVAANDAVSRDYSVVVLPPPVLVPLGPDEPSPRVQLFYPRYTDLASPATLPAGTGNVEAVSGTAVSFRARADRALRSAAIEFLPEERATAPCLFLSALGARHVLAVASAIAGGHTVWSPVPALLDEDHCAFTVDFLPRANGLYALHFEDQSGLAGNRIFELHLRADPAPAVQLDRPSPARDLLSVLPDATLTLHATADDPIFAVRNVFLEYRVGRDALPARLSLYDRDTLAARIAPVAGPGVLAAPPRPRPQRVEIDQPLPVESLVHDDGSPPREGEAILLTVCADDFDDVTLDKQPGRSHEVEIHIVGREALDVAINQEQTRLQRDLLRTREKERDALSKVTSVENDLKKGTPFGPDQLDQVLQAEQAQQQVREQITTEKDGLRARAERVLETLRQNHLTNSPERGRVQDVARELDRLSGAELNQAESQLASARTRAELPEEKPAAEREPANEARRAQARAAEEAARDKMAEAAKAGEAAEHAPDQKESARLKAEAETARKQAETLQDKARELSQSVKEPSRDSPDSSASARPREALSDARHHQEEIEKTLTELLQRMEPWTSSREIKGEAGRLLQEQQKLQTAVEELSQRKDIQPGASRENLTDAQRAELDAMSSAQKKLEERTTQLLDKMGRVAEERKQKDPATAQELQDARERAVSENITSKMQEAADQVSKNQLGKARKNQRDSAAALKQLLKDLEERREAELERLAKKSREAEKELDQLFQEQERLKKKMKEAEAIADPKQREEALQSLHRQQKELNDKAKDLLQRLTRDDSAGRGRQSLGQAAEKMEQAAQQLSRGEDANPAMDDALDRLDEARAEAEQNTDRVEDELGREQRARIADILKRFKERQDALVAETVRVQRRLRETAEKGAITRPFRSSLGDLATNQDDLGKEVVELAKKELKDTPVFAGLAKRSADAMAAAGRRLSRVRAPGFPPDRLPDVEAASLQATAARRLEQVMSAIKDDDSGGRLSRASGGGGGSGAGGAGDEGLPPTAQLKVLRKMQQDINRRTESFARDHQDPEKIDDAAKSQLQAIMTDQKDVSELLEQLRGGAEPESAPEGGRP
jgi:hypothetical protein